MIRNARCADCRFSEVHGGPIPDVECHRRAPEARLVDEDMNEKVWAYWPQVLEDDWCGEFKEK
jgi:hypothetical protein